MQTLPFVDPDAALASLNNLKYNIKHAHLVKNYQDTDSYADITSTKSVANIAISGPDMGITDESGDKVLTINGKNGLIKTQNSDRYETGTATAGSNTALTDTGAAFGARAGKVVHITEGTGLGLSAKILSGNTATVLSFLDIGVALDGTSKYEILDDLVIAYVDSTNNKIKLVVEEKTDQAISAASGNSVNISLVTHRIKKANEVVG